MGNKYDTLVGFRSGDDLPLGRQPVRDFGGEISGLPKLLVVLLYDKGGHPSALKVGSEHD